MNNVTDLSEERLRSALYEALGELQHIPCARIERMSRFRSESGDHVWMLDLESGQTVFVSAAEGQRLSIYVSPSDT